MRVFVAGATGVLGRATVRLLIDAGHDVRGAARSEANRSLLSELGATPADCDLFDAESVRSAVGDAEAVLHLATKIPPIMKMRSAKAWDENNRLRTDGTRNLVEAARAAGSKVFVQESITFIYAAGGDDWLTEESPVVPAWPAALESTIEMERIVRTFEGEGRRAVILRFGLFYGPESASTHDSVKMMRRRMFPVMGAGGNYFSSIHVDDAARAVVAALEAPGGTYNVVEDEPVTQREYADACAKAFDTPRPWSFPAWTAQLMMGGPAKYVMQSMRVSNKKFKAVTGWSPDYPGVGDGFRQVAEEMAKAVK